MAALKRLKQIERRWRKYGKIRCSYTICCKWSCYLGYKSMKWRLSPHCYHKNYFPLFSVSNIWESYSSDLHFLYSIHHNARHLHVIFIDLKLMTIVLVSVITNLLVGICGCIVDILVFILAYIPKDLLNYGKTTFKEIPLFL